MATRRAAERAARRFIRRYYAYRSHWLFDICEESDGERRKSWSFGLTPDEEDDDYEPGVHMTGYVHADGRLEGMY